MSAGSGRYAVPGGRHSAETVIERSRFLCTIDRASSVSDAQKFVKEISARHSDATHNCWAYVVGEPGNTGQIGMSDDGEPHGTAGRPMLTVLLHSGVGDIAAVVTRWFGGTKLGTGGLVKAYSGSVQSALAEMPRGLHLQLTEGRIRISYGDLATVRQLYTAHEVEVTSEEYGVDVVLTVRLPVEQCALFDSAVQDATRGQSRLATPEEKE